MPESQLSACSQGAHSQSATASGRPAALGGEGAVHNRPGLWGRCRPSYVPVPGAALPRRRLRNDAGPAELDGSTRLRRQTQAPKSGGRRPAELAGHAVFFPDIVGVGAGKRVLGALPGDGELLESGADGFVADLARGDTLGKTDFGGQRQGPDAAVFAEGAWALVQQGPQTFAAL